MKKALAIALILMLLVSMLAACGGEPAAQETEPSQPSHQTAQTAGHQAAEDFAGGTGTEADPFQISEAGHLVLLHELLKKEAEEINFDDTYVKGHFILTADIALNDTSDFSGWSTTAPEFGWIPIGSGITTAFAGVLDGNGHRISGMYIDSADGPCGLFADLQGTVKNLTLTQSYIRASGSTAAVGTFAGNTFEATIENCHADTVMEVSAVDSVGGIAGKASTVTDCTFSGTVTQLDEGYVHMGGIAGSGGTISGCSFSGTLNGKGYTGGIAGYGSNAARCVNRGTVSGDTAGGIVGRIYAAGTDLEIEEPQRTVENCINEGQVNGAALAGGIVGWMGNDESDISMAVLNCENKGQVSGSESAAGIIGKLSVERSGLMEISNCINHSDISGAGKTGGIISELTGIVQHQEGKVLISGCKNLGSITSQDQNSGGILAYLLVMGNETDLDLTVQDCTNEGAIRSTRHAGGILAFSNVGFNADVSSLSLNNTAVSLTDCVNSGSVTVTSSNAMAGGIAGVIGLGHIPTRISGCTNSGAVAVDFTLTDGQTAELQGSEWPEYFQIAGGIVGRVGDALTLSTALDTEADASRVNTPDGTIRISGCSSTGTVTAPDYSTILNKAGQPLFVNYLGGILGQCSATEGYAFCVEGCTFSGTQRGLGDTAYPDVVSN